MTQYIKVKDGLVIGHVMDRLPSSIQLDDGSWVTGTENLTTKKAAGYGYYKIVIPTISYDKKTEFVRFTEVIIPDDSTKTASPTYEILPIEEPFVEPLQPINVDLKGLTLARSGLKANTQSI